MSIEDATVRVDWGSVRPVVTRRDRRARDSRRVILSAAVDCLVERGYAQASTVAVQRRADVSRGRLLHYYPSKDALLVAAAHRLAAAQVAGTTAADLVADDASDARIDEAVGAMWQRYQELYFRAATELWVAAAHNDALRSSLQTVERQLNVAIRDAVAVLFGPVHARHEAFGSVCSILLTSMRGLAVADAFDGRERRHERHLRDWIRMARTMLLTDRG